MPTSSQKNATGIPYSESIINRRQKRHARRTPFTVEKWAVICLSVALVFLLSTTLISYHYIDSFHVDHHQQMLRNLAAPISSNTADTSTIQDENYDEVRDAVPEIVNGGGPWSRPMIHVMSTRFMQNQGSLIHLGRARLALFKAVCLPSVVGQTITSSGEEGDDPAFLWIVKVDPHLDESIRNEMIELLKPYPNFYLIGSNENFGVGHKQGTWRGGEVGEELIQSMKDGRLYTGDYALIRRAHDSREDRIVLETRLDADDGLDIRFLEVIQMNAVDTFINAPKKARWKYWCAMNQVEWKPIISTTTAGDESKMGSFIPRKTPHLCITPGLTLGFPVGAKGNDVPRYPHDKIVETLKQKGGCGLSYKSCYHLIGDNPMMLAIRARTPTSAGMQYMNPKKKDVEKMKVLAQKVGGNDSFLRLFGISKDTIQKTTAYIRDNLLLMTEDNMKGQCTKEHSCKLESKETLQRIIDLHGNGPVNGIETIKIADEYKTLK